MGFFKKTKVFGRPIRKVKVAAGGAVLLTVFVWINQAFDLGFQEPFLKDMTDALAATVALWTPVFQSYFSRSAPADVENIPFE